MLPIVARLFVTLLACAGGGASYVLARADHGMLAIFMVLITCISVYIFVAPRAYPYRYMYPGLITFLFFMVLPTLFIVVIGFTNLGTGHFLSQKDVYRLLLDETVVDESAHERYFNLIETSMHKEGYVEMLVAPLDPSAPFATAALYAQIPLSHDKDAAAIVDLQPVGALQPPLEAGGIRFLNKGALFAVRDAFKARQFRFPDGTLLGFFQVGVVLVSHKRFEPAGDERLKEAASGDVYYPDLKEGFYTNGQKSLPVGFYVGVGWQNYSELMTHPGLKHSFAKIFTWSFVWALLSVLLTFALGMSLSLLVGDKFLKGKVVYRVLLIIPYAIPFFISVLVFRGLLNQEFGIINDLLARLGFAKVNWLGDPLMAKVSCLTVNLWLGFPYMMLVTTGILQSIPDNIYEAAAIDGAGKWAAFRHITLPLIFSAVGPLLVGSFAFSFNNFAVIYLLNQGLPPIIGAITPAGETDILISYTYKLAFAGQGKQDLGLASSVALLVFMIVTAITLLNFKLFGMFKDEKS